MATSADIHVFSVPGSYGLWDLQQFIKYNETLLSEFVYMEASAGDNLLYYEKLPTDQPRDSVFLQAIPPGLSGNAIARFIDQLVDHGLQPFKSYFNVMVSGMLASILPCRQGTPPPLPAPLTGWIPTVATVFGLNMDGTRDEADNGVGAPILGSVNTTNRSLIGCALPIPVLKARFGSLVGARGKTIRVSLPDGSRETVVPIVDLGPSNAQIRKGVALDLTFGAQRAIGGNGFTGVLYNLS
ncbi:MAG: uracil phosphoribosyltransferase [Verrucomicrobiota bacterium]|nr:uracil phosphoribosyltransferase [Verrucomicrobiota bacterium]